MTALYENFTKHPSAYVKNFSKIDSIVLPALEKVFMGEQSAKEAMEAIAPDVKQYIDGKYMQ